MRSTFIFFLLAVVVFSLDSCHSTSTFQTGAYMTDAEGCAQATEIQFTDNLFSYDGVFSNIGDAKYFYLSGMSSHSWISLEAWSESLDSRSFNPVISILNGDGTKRLASVERSRLLNDDDAYFYYHFASDLPVCIKIESYKRWTDSLAPKDLKFTQLPVAFRTELNPIENHSYESIDQDMRNNTTASSIPFDMKTKFESDGVALQWVHGELNAADDVDMFSFIAPSTETVIDIYIETIIGNGIPKAAVSGTGTSASTTVQLLNQLEQVVSEFVYSPNNYYITATLQPDEKYYLRITGADSWSSGENDFYNLLTAVSNPDTYQMESDAPNETPNTAQLIELQIDHEHGYLHASILGQIDEADDIDYFRCPIEPGQMMMVICNGESIGSGLQNLTLRATDENGIIIQEGKETKSGIEWSDGPDATGSPLLGNVYEDVYLSLTANHTDMRLSRFYECFLLIF